MTISPDWVADWQTRRTGGRRPRRRTTLWDQIEFRSPVITGKLL
jgi:hypothetical protein